MAAEGLEVCDKERFRGATPMNRHEITLKKGYLDQWRDLVGRHGVSPCEANVATMVRVDIRSGDLFLSLPVDARLGEAGLVVMVVPRFGRNLDGSPGLNWDIPVDEGAGLVH